MIMILMCGQLELVNHVMGTIIDIMVMVLMLISSAASPPHLHLHHRTGRGHSELK